ncbi:hypothetical protein [Portibacter lacus]|uniref:CBU-0592-like domain-containing protein n=1 Tax=Portibacter lacus TaxID=1099794 RepID=A0AA37WFW3_9BACT|nr:hypothetical protein [Portibacter lacus]GLR19107.1 hypothetical protein GCM10007940_37230 [Portibacter lacus]
MEIFFNVIGWLGSGLVITAYALTLKSEKFIKVGRYFNLIGGVLIASNCYYFNAIPPFVSNLIWAIIATFTIFKSRKEGKIISNI